MIKNFLIFIMFVLQITLFSKQSFSFFSVKKINVSKTSYSSSQAKKEALALAREQAFNTVLNRILISTDIPNVIIPDTYNMEKFVQSLKLSNEKTSSTSYTADVDVMINKSLIQDYLSNQGFVFLKDSLPNTLIIFADNDKFGFKHQDYTQYPFNTAKIHTYITKKPFENITSNDFDNLLIQYNVNNIIWVSINKIDENIFEVIFKDKLLNIEENFETTYENFAYDLIKNINDSYKKHLYNKNLDNYISIIIPLYSLSDWLEIKKNISKLPVFKDMIVQALKFNRVQIKVKYRYDLNSVLSALSTLGYTIDKKDNYLIIKR